MTAPASVSQKNRLGGPGAASAGAVYLANFFLRNTGWVVLSFQLDFADP
jgi:hypothetical protein